MADGTPQDMRGAVLLDQAKKQYPILNKVPMQFAYQPKDVKAPEGAMLESYLPGETDRPKSFPLNQFGMAVFSPKTTPKDILGDVVSHYMIQNDPTVKAAYESFLQGLTPQNQSFLQELYKEAQVREGEKRSFDEWTKMTGIPSMFRGYMFDQYAPAEFSKAYTPEQIAAFDKLKTYLGMK